MNWLASQFALVTWHIAETTSITSKLQINHDTTVTVFVNQFKFKSYRQEVAIDLLKRGNVTAVFLTASHQQQPLQNSNNAATFKLKIYRFQLVLFFADFCGLTTQVLQHTVHPQSINKHKEPH